MSGGVVFTIYKKIEGFNRKITQKANSLLEIFWPSNFHIAAVISLPAPIVTRKAIMMTTSHAMDLMKHGTEIDIATK